MNNVRKRGRLIAGIALIALLFSCGGPQKENADSVTQKKTEKQMIEATRQIGLPAIVNFQEKKLMKQIYELRDQEKLICHAYLFNSLKGEVGQYLGQCVGYGLPYSTQFSNPQKYSDVFHGNGGSYGKFMPQAEPNGLFMPEGLSATWLLMLDEKGNPHPVYIEPEIIVSPFKLTK